MTLTVFLKSTCAHDANVVFWTWDIVPTPNRSLSVEDNMAKKGTYKGGKGGKGK